MDDVIAWTEADVIRKLRAESGITLKRLAAESHIAITTINRIEMGQTADAKPDTLQRLARVFGLSYEDLLAAVPRKHPGVPLRVPDGTLVKWRAERKRQRARRAVIGE